MILDKVSGKGHCESGIWSKAKAGIWENSKWKNAAGGRAWKFENNKDQGWDQGKESCEKSWKLFLSNVYGLCQLT